MKDTEGTINEQKVLRYILDWSFRALLPWPEAEQLFHQLSSFVRIRRKLRLHNAINVCDGDATNRIRGFPLHVPSTFMTAERK
jgi:hypothetical protein